MTKPLLVFIFLFMLVACDRQYTVSEDKFTEVANEQMRAFQDKHEIFLTYKSSQVRFLIHKVNIDLMAKKGGLVQLQTNASLIASLNVFGEIVKQTFDVSPTFEAGLSYDNGQFFLNNPRLVTSTVKPTNFIERQIFALLDQVYIHIEQVPIYRLENSLEEVFSAMVISDVEITDTELIFHN